MNLRKDHYRSCSSFRVQWSFGCDRLGPLPLSVRGTRRSPSGCAEGARGRVELGRQEEPIKGEVLPSPHARAAVGPPRAPLHACSFFSRLDVWRVVSARVRWERCGGGVVRRCAAERVSKREKLLTVDPSVRASMKNAANCDT